MKKRSLTRRKFLKAGSVLGAAAMVPGSLFRNLKAATPQSTAQIALVKSTDAYKAALEAVKAMGGMSKFVPENSKVGILVNGNFTNDGTYTNPDVSLAVIKMCFDSGANEVMLIKGDNEDNWKKSPNYETHKDLLEKTTRSLGNKMVNIPKGKTLKEAEMIQEIDELDILINIPIAKHHNSAYLTCCLKNMMGLCTRSTNVLFHSATGERPTDKDRLAQCIADINTVRMPDLTVVDATSFIMNNGPHGPGELLIENTVLAGTDPVALDAYCANYLEYEPGMVASTDYAAEHGLGIADLSRVDIMETELI